MSVKKRKRIEIGRKEGEGNGENKGTTMTKGGEMQRIKSDIQEDRKAIKEINRDFGGKRSKNPDKRNRSSSVTH